MYDGYPVHVEFGQRLFQQMKEQESERTLRQVPWVSNIYEVKKVERVWRQN